MDAKDLLEEEIKTQIEDLKYLSPGSEEKSRAIEDVAKLYRVRVDELKADYDYSDKYERLEAEREQNKIQLAEQQKDRKIRVVETVVPLTFYTAFLIAGFRFEKTGNFCSKTFLNFINRVRPTKR